MATHAHTPSIPSRRRAMFAAAGAVIMGGGITSGIAASAADYQLPSAPDNPDLELIAVCAAFNSLERDIQATSGSGRDRQEDRESLRQQQEPLLDRICAMPCRTLAGASALATSLVLWEASELDGEDDPDACMNERLLSALVRGLVGRA